MLKIDMLEFFRSGEFAGVRSGLSCAQIASMFAALRMRALRARELKF